MRSLLDTFELTSEILLAVLTLFRELLKEVSPAPARACTKRPTLAAPKGSGPERSARRPTRLNLTRASQRVAATLGISLRGPSIRAARAPKLVSYSDAGSENSRSRHVFSSVVLLKVSESFSRAWSLYFPEHIFN